MTKPKVGGRTRNDENNNENGLKGQVYEMPGEVENTHLMWG
jgi:hypothetical protein